MDIIFVAVSCIYIHRMKDSLKRISDFIKEAKCLSVATQSNEGLWCASCYYAYDEKNVCLIFKSSDETRHVQDGLKNPVVAGTILPDKLETVSIKGVQFTGTFMEAKDDETASLYYNRFPFARAIGGRFWVIKLKTMKYTDNTLGFGTKLHWQLEK
ncbi:MAG: hypothetical protein RL007_2807 [Bacteroidota bacterium]